MYDLYEKMEGIYKAIMLQNSSMTDNKQLENSQKQVNMDETLSRARTSKRISGTYLAFNVIWNEDVNILWM